MVKRNHTLWTVIALLGTTPAVAVPVDVSITGAVDNVDGTFNPFGLNVGDTITGTAHIPDADLSGSQTYSAADGLLMTWNIGTTIFTEAQDLLFPASPTITLLDGVFVDLLYNGDNGLGSAFGAFLGLWNAFGLDFQTGDFAILDGTFTAVATPVINAPEPATLSLLGMGLIAVGMTRRRKSRQGLAA